MTKGELIVVTEGYYDDYQIKGHYRVLKSVDDTDVFLAYIKGREKIPSRGVYPSGEFLDWAVENGFLEPTHGIRELSLGEYGELDPRLYRPSNRRSWEWHFKRLR